MRTRIRPRPMIVPPAGAHGHVKVTSPTREERLQRKMWAESPAPRARSACSARCGQRWVWVQCRCMPGIGVWHVKVTSPTCEERLQRKMWAEVGVGAVQ
eukprot:1144300-Pelagomonas_calceolata.AAC.3